MQLKLTMLLYIKQRTISFLFASFILFSCNNSNNYGLASVNKDSTIDKKNQPVKIDSSKLKKKINFNLLYGNWIKYDTVYEGKYISVKPLFKDTDTLVKRIEGYRKRGMCDGGCIFASKFTRDGWLYTRSDDIGESYPMTVDSGKNIIFCYTHMIHGNKAPADTIIIEITYLDDKFLLEYYPGKPGATEMFKRTKWDFR